jgi:glutamate-1-semialdehyde 2,1-aminomutase/neamine transaminase/2'-deamino-2'-hydroxyneamine transaminase/neomycin C transaminase
MDTAAAPPVPGAASALQRAVAVTSSPRWDVAERYPIVFARADGAYAWDVAGRRYLDLTSASGAAPLGARHPAVRAALLRAVDELGGILPSTISEQRTAVARGLVDIFPCGERVAFMRTGSCATTAAVRIARAATGRRLVLTSGFHGWHDWHLQARADAGRADDGEVVDFGYSLATLRRVAEAARRPPAAVIVTPEPAFFPEPYYRELERVVRACGALLIYDEVMTGLRYAVGGFHGATGGSPDLITVSKGLANGTALSAVVGRAEVMAGQEATYLGNTYLREVTPFAVAEATLPIMTGGAIDAMNARGAQLRDGLTAVFTEHGVAARAIGPGPMFDVVFRDDRWGGELYRRLRAEGVLLDYGGKHMTSAVTTAAQVDEVLALVDRLAGELARGADLPRGAGGRVPFGTLTRVAHTAINADPDELAKWT